MKSGSARRDLSVSARLDRVEGKALKCELAESRDAQDFTKSSEANAAALQKLSCDVVQLLEQALGSSCYTNDSAAEEMGLSGSLFSRQRKNVDNQHISLQRLWKLSDRFWLEFCWLVLVRRRLARVRRRVFLEVVS
jgi:hypothetical protein